MMISIKTTLMTMLILLASFNIVKAQSISQTIKGQVTDAASKSPLPGATIAVISLEKPSGTITDKDGYYKIENVPVGRHSIQVSYLGYEPVRLSEILVGTGKEVVIDVELSESIIALEGVEVTATKNSKGETVNSMSMISARGFNVEETRRYAGGFDDPVRLASVYAGVASSSSVENNAIMIRGNSPIGVLWQVEGMVVPNPTHFANADILGGGSITMFSNQILSNSDFYTGALPAEMGNAYSGAFDVRFREGNTEKHEHAFQVGAMGIDAASEGPILKNKRSSYLFNYRYSTLGLLSQFLPEGEGLPVYQDLSFKIKLPAGERAHISLWGIGGLDEFNQFGEDDTAKWDFENLRKDIRSNFKSGTIGARYRKLFHTDAYLEVSAAASGYYQKNNANWLNPDQTKSPLNRSEYTDTRYSIKTMYNKKHTAKLTTRYGIIGNMLGYTYNVSIANNDLTDLINVSDVNGDSYMWQGFAQAQYKLSPTLTVNAGLHAMHFALNKKNAIDPRAGIKWQVSPRNNLSLAYGIHSQQQLLSTYFVERQQPDGSSYFPNKNLEFTKAQHFILAYNLRLWKNMRVRLEPYYQVLDNLAVVENSPVAMINVENLHDFNYTLVSEGSGRNFGIDVTLERFLNKGYYYLLTASLFESKFTGTDNIERNTRFNNNFLVNALGGKEWKIGKKKNQIVGVNARVYIKGGDRLTPVDLQASLENESIEYNYEEAFEEQASTTYRVDFTFNYQMNFPNYALIFSTQINNVLSSPTTYDYVYDYTQKTVRLMEDGNPFPNVSLKIEF